MFDFVFVFAFAFAGSGERTQYSAHLHLLRLGAFETIVVQALQGRLIPPRNGKFALLPFRTPTHAHAHLAIMEGTPRGTASRMACSASSSRETRTPGKFERGAQGGESGDRGEARAAQPWGAVWAWECSLELRTARQSREVRSEGVRE